MLFWFYNLLVLKFSVLDFSVVNSQFCNSKFRIDTAQTQCKLNEKSKWRHYFEIEIDQLIWVQRVLAPVAELLGILVTLVGLNDCVCTRIVTVR